MSTTAPRFIIVDNVDPSIQYTGPWFLDKGSQDSVGNFGPPYQSTLHGADANASLSFAFNGSQVIVIGTNNIRNDSGVLDPTWQCFVDGVSIGASAPFAFPENNWIFCNDASLVDGPHVLTVNATVLKNQTFWFDNIQYLPSASVPLDQAAIMVDHLDPQLQYGAGWGALGTTANMTTVAGSTLTFDFFGVSLRWYGFIPRELPLGPSSGTYSIDGGTPISFRLNGLPANTATTYNQKFFETDQLSATSHTLKVVYQGNNSTPLTLTDLIIQNGTLSSTTTSVSSQVATATSDPFSGTRTAGKKPVGAIVGGVIGGLALILFAILGFFIFRRRQKRAAQEKVFISTPQPFEYTHLHPSGITPNHSLGGVSYSQVPQTASATTSGVKGQVYLGPMPSATNTDASQSVEPQSTSTYSTNSRAVRPQQTALTLANPSSSSPPASSSSSSAHSPPLALPRKVGREVEALATLRPQRRGDPSVPASVRSNDSWLSNANVVLHADSGIRIPPSTSVVDVPPLYTPD